MINYGIMSLFLIVLVLIFAAYYCLTLVKAEISKAKALQEGNLGVPVQIAALKKEIDALEARQREVEESPKRLLKRFEEVEESLGKVDRIVAKFQGQLSSVQGRLSAIVKGRKGRDDEDDDDMDRAPQGESDGTSFLPPGSQNQERPAATGIPPGFGKVVKRRAA